MKYSNQHCLIGLKQTTVFNSARFPEYIILWSPDARVGLNSVISTNCAMVYQDATFEIRKES